MPFLGYTKEGFMGDSRYMCMEFGFPLLQCKGIALVSVGVIVLCIYSIFNKYFKMKECVRLYLRFHNCIFKMGSTKVGIQLEI